MACMAYRFNLGIDSDPASKTHGADGQPWSVTEADVKIGPGEQQAAVRVALKLQEFPRVPKHACCLNRHMPGDATGLLLSRRAETSCAFKIFLA